MSHDSEPASGLRDFTNRLVMMLSGDRRQQGLVLACLDTLPPDETVRETQDRAHRSALADLTVRRWTPSALRDAGYPQAAAGMERASNPAEAVRNARESWNPPEERQPGNPAMELAAHALEAAQLAAASPEHTPEAAARALLTACHARWLARETGREDTQDMNQAEPDQECRRAVQRAVRAGRTAERETE